MWEVETVGSNLVLRGTSGVAMASALNWWLKYKCNSVYLWQEQQINIPNPPPVVSPKMRSSSPFQYRYYYNVCTFGYSSAFWHWDRWEREIDWMALNGINFPLAFVGQEYVWQAIFADLGMNETLVRESWFSAAAFLPWNRMGNINNWAGPLSVNFITSQVLLQKQILQRQRSFGMKAILPGFAGHVPPPFSQFFPQANVSTLVWDPEFGNTYTLSPQDPLFHRIGNAFVKKVTEIFGSDSYYNADPFNEMDPSSNDTSYLKAVSTAIYKSMSDADPNAVWVLQGWFLLDGFWQPPQTQAFLDGAPDDRLIVLDLWAEVDPYWSGHQNFYGKNFIWCMLHDFGGRSGLYAAFDSVNQGVAAAATQAPNNMVGIGLTPEAIETNPIIYDFMMEFSWTSQARDVDAWTSQWAVRRYGQPDVNAQTYWLTLRSQILNCNTDQMAATATPIVMRPNFFIPPTVGCCANTQQYYDPSKLDQAWTLLLQSRGKLQNIQTYRNDLIEITRQVLGDYSYIVYNNLITAYNTSNINALNQSVTEFLGIFDDLEALFNTQSDYMLGTWVNRAEMWGVTPDESHQLRRGALLQVTTWGPATESNGLHEYAFKLWSGLVGHYYRSRWELFTRELQKTVTNHSAFSMDRFHRNMYAFEAAYVNNTYPYPTVAQGDTLDVSLKLRAKYSNIQWPAYRKRATQRKSSVPPAQRKRRFKPN